MRFVYRWLRRGLTAIFVVGLVSGSLYFAYTRVIGIADEVEHRREQNERDGFRAQTATAFAPTLDAESVALKVGNDGEENIAAVTTEELPTEVTQLPTDEPTSETSEPVEENTPEATEDSSIETSTETATVESTEAVDEAPTETETPSRDEVAAVPSNTPTVESPTATDSPTETDIPVPTTEQPTETATLVPTTPVPTQVAQEPPTAFPTNTLPAQRPTALPTNTLFPTNTHTPTNTPTATFTSTPTSTHTPTYTFTPSNTPTPTFTSTPSPTPLPTLVIEGTYATPVNTPIAQIPLRAPLVEDDPNIVNVVLLGSDTVGSSLGQTDVIIIVSINQTVGSVAMWHIPRDLLVYIPSDTIDRINRVFPVGQQNGWVGGGGGLMKETILYNFGIEVDYYARVDFQDFREIINELGSLTISVDCPITGWRLLPDWQVNQPPPEAFQDPGWEPYWENYTLPIGTHDLNSYMALWYARDRVSTSDLDRGRRQQDVLRAIFRQARENGLIEQAANLAPRLLEIVDTDMSTEDLLSFVPIALSLDLGNIERYNLRNGVHMESWFTPDDGRSVFLGNWQAIQLLAQQFVTPPTGNRLRNEAASVEVLDATVYGLGWGRVASDRLAWEGFSPIVTESRTVQEVTQIIDFTGLEKGSELERLQEILRVDNSSIIQAPDPDRQYDYRVVVGRSYRGCYNTSSADEVEIPETPLDDVPEGVQQ